MLDNRGMSVRNGILVRLESIPDQCADVHQGLWLTKDRRFQAFTVAVSRVNNSLEIERFEDITDNVVVSDHVPGTGKTFGYLALEVLKKLTS
jgi:hypothetical protein